MKSLCDISTYRNSWSFEVFEETMLFNRRNGALRDAQAQAAELVYQRQEAAYAEAARTLNKERLEKQGLARGRDWDLSRPDHLRIDWPAR